MKKMKKQLSMLLAVLLILTVFPCRVSAEEPDAKWIDGALLNSFGEEGGWMRDGNGNYLYLRPMEPAAVLAVPNILQNPELPTGCESVALTMLLHYWGYDTLGKTEIADHYLSYDTTNFVSSFVEIRTQRTEPESLLPGLLRRRIVFCRRKGTGGLRET